MFGHVCSYPCKQLRGVRISPFANTMARKTGVSPRRLWSQSQSSRQGLRGRNKGKRRSRKGGNLSTVEPAYLTRQYCQNLIDPPGQKGRQRGRRSASLRGISKSLCRSCCIGISGATEGRWRSRLMEPGGMEVMEPGVMELLVGSRNWRGFCKSPTEVG